MLRQTAENGVMALDGRPLIALPLACFGQLWRGAAGVAPASFRVGLAADALFTQPAFIPRNARRPAAFHGLSATISGFTNACCMSYGSRRTTVPSALAK